MSSVSTAWRNSGGTFWLVFVSGCRVSDASVLCQFAQQYRATFKLAPEGKLLFIQGAYQEILRSVIALLIVYQEGIIPAWEDEANKHGGKWSIQLPKDKNRERVDKMWLYTVRP